MNGFPQGGLKHMLGRLARVGKRAGLALSLALVPVTGVPALAQEIQAVDPDAAIDADLAEGQAGSTAPAPISEPDMPSAQVPGAQRYDPPVSERPSSTQGGASFDNAPSQAARAAAADPSTTYAEDDLIGAAEGLFGQGAEGLARVIEDVLSKQGEPNGYIVGREGGGALVLGVRYGSGTLFHKVEGQKPVYWTGPSIGLDAGANAGNTFVLVYNLYDTEELYERYPAGEGQAYLVGGFTASYLRKGNVVLIPIRVGAGLRLGVNAGYMRFSKKQRWLPF